MSNKKIDAYIFWECSKIPL